MNKPVLLAAEDNDLDALLLDRMIARCGSKVHLVRVPDGATAIDYLQGAGDYMDRTRHPPADLLLLDLKMPRVDGFGVLRWRQENAAQARLPIIVFSSSNLPEDVTLAYSLGANSYVAKPSDPQRLEGMLNALHQWWVDFNIAAERS